MTTSGVRESAVPPPGQGQIVDASSDPASSLTPREHQVMTLLALGMAYKEVAAVLGLSLHTVKEQARRAHRRLGVQSTIEAMNALGWVRL